MTDQAQLAFNQTELMYEVLRLFPLLKGVARDAGGDFVFDGHKLTNAEYTGPLYPNDSARYTDALTIEAMENHKTLHGLMSVLNIARCFILGKGVCRAASTSNKVVNVSTALPVGGLDVDGVLFTATSQGYRDLYLPYLDLATRMRITNATVGKTGTQLLTQPVAPSADFPTGFYVDPRGGVFVDFILLKDQTDTAENGVYAIVVSGSNYTLVRSLFHDDSSKMGLGSCIAVSEGAVNKGAVFMVTESEWDASPDNLVPGLESIGASTVATNVVYTKVLYESGAAVANAASSTAGALETTLNQIIASLKSTGLMNT